MKQPNPNMRTYLIEVMRGSTVMTIESLGW